MHGTVLSQSEAHRRKSSQHMPSWKTSAYHFLKDGRTISVGDCALFKPPWESPPFIGIIRRLSYSKENNLQLSVNWLYRPAELKLGKGILLDVAPNEIFYSFHKDDIPAASLLHPCRVAFLPNGVELPSGIASLVCRRVYDIENKCLWWLTDQNYIDERQEEVDQLLHKTRIEMQAKAQTAGRSPKRTNGPTSTSQLKPASDSVQDMTSFTSQVKGKRRERGDQCSEPLKRERATKTDDGDSSRSKTDSSLKSEIARITEKGGLVDSEGVEKLVHLMQPGKVEKKLGLICRSMLARVIASTDKFDCLNKFVQLRGLPVLDEWLQDFHKGKIGDNSSSKDFDRSVEDFVFVILTALDKLPVNLHALQMCNIGKSVNHLRSHKNLEIQKKARSLVDTWKKRVEAEMNIIDAKSGSYHTVTWSSKSDSHGRNRNSVGSGDIATKSSVTQLAAGKASSSKPSLGEPTKSASSPPGPVKSVSSPSSIGDSQPRTTVGGVSDVTSTVRDDKSSSSSQSLSVKEDAKSSTAGSMTVLNKVSSGGSRHRKLKNGCLVASVSGGQKETASSRNFSLPRSSATEKLSHSGLTGEQAPDMPVVEGGSQKLIVKIPNRSRSPAQSANGGSLEDYSITSSRASSPVLFHKHDQIECNSKDRSDGFRANNTPDVNAESWQSNDFKDVPGGSDDGDGSPAALPGDEQSRTTEDIRKAGVSKAVSMPSGNKMNSGKSCGASFCSMTALIESCVKYSETNTSISIGDDVGMNLLASVAAGEISNSDGGIPTDSPQRSSPVGEEACIDDDAKSKPSSANDLLQDGSKPNNEADGCDKKPLAVATISCQKYEYSKSTCALPEHCGDKKAVSSSSEEKLSGQSIKFSNSASADLQTAVNHCLEIDEMLDEMKGVTSLLPPGMAGKGRDGQLNRLAHEEKALGSIAGVSDATLGGTGSSATELNMILNVDDMKKKAEVTSSNHSSENDNKNEVLKMVNPDRHLSPKSPSMVANGEVLPPQISEAGDADEQKVGGADEKGSGEVGNESEKHKHVNDTCCTSAVVEPSKSSRASKFADQKRDTVESNEERRKLLAHQSPKSTQKESSVYTSEDALKRIGMIESNLPGAGTRLGEFAPTMTEASSSFIAEATDADSKMKFDLNEGLFADDGKCVEQASVSPSSVQIISSLPLAAASGSGGLRASVTVTAAAKGPFVPPEDLLRSKAELGWKGSAATSAFRPAEPRKVSQASLTSAAISPTDAFTSKHSRAPLDFDLNVPDERILEDLASRDSTAAICSSSNLSSDGPRASVAGRSSWGIDLDLNKTDDTNDMGQHSASSIHRPEPPTSTVQSLRSGRLPTDEVRRDFDLNSGPSGDDANSGQSSYDQHGGGSMHTHLATTLLRSNNPDRRNFSSWFPPGNSYSSVTIPSILPDRAGALPKFLGPTGSTPFIPDVLRGSVLSSSSAVAFPSAPFQYPVYPFGATFPLSSTTFAVGSTSYINASPGGMLFAPLVNSQSMGHDTVLSQYPRPCVVSLPGGNGVSSAESNGKLGRQGLDLNAGPGTLDVERREQSFLMVPNQLSLASSQSLAEEQARICAVGGGVLKRKEPDGNRDNERSRYKQSSWK